jgi:chorismate mutase
VIYVAHPASQRLIGLRTFLEDKGGMILTWLLLRSQYSKNAPIYVPGGVEVENYDGAYVDLFLNGKDEIRRAAAYKLQKDPEISLYDKIRGIYIPRLDGLCEQGDDGEYAPSARTDARVLSGCCLRGLKGGIDVANIKFDLEPDEYIELASLGRIKGGEAMMEKITDSGREEYLLDTSYKKALTYGMNAPLVRGLLGDLIDATKLVEINHIFGRAEGYRATK